MRLCPTSPRYTGADAPTMSADAIVVGAGHNGLVAAILLAKAGWKVLVLEGNEKAGGAIRTEEVTLPGYRHDLFATNLNLFAGSMFHEETATELASHGLEFIPSQRPFASVFPDSTYLGVSTDPVEVLRCFEAAGCSSGDAENWTALASRFSDVAPHLFPLLGVDMPSISAVRALLRGRKALGRDWPFEVARLALQSSRELTEEHFESPRIHALMASWGMHLDFPPDISGGALFSFIETFASATNGMVLGRGGASNMVDSLVGVLEANGGQLRLGSRVSSVSVDGGVATGVVLSDGEVIKARRAVIANVSPSLLFTKLVDEADLPATFKNGISRFRHGPGTLMIHLAMNQLPDWAAGPELKEWSYVHLGPYMEDMSLAYQQAMAGLIPERPTLVVGQPTAVDPSRAPEGKHILWIQARMVPAKIRGDAAGLITETSWEKAKELVADRVIGIIGKYAPGISDQILDQCVLSPLDLERYNPNLVGGDSLGGSHHPMQHFLFRPTPGWSHHETPIDRLFMCGAGTWPGAGVGAGSGYLLGKRLTKRRTRKSAR
jgi:phytoene dehydrogenase-like protein